MWQKISTLFFGYICVYLFSTVMAEVEIISKEGWNGKAAKHELDNLELPVDRVVITHTAGADCNNKESCGQKLRNIQHYHMETLNFDDIASNFLIGNDGNVYEGRGWDNQGALVKGYNAGTLGVTFIGTFDKVVPSDKALEAAKALFEMGISLGKINENYNLYGHCQLSPTSSPGGACYAVIKTWPHWTDKI